MKCLCIKPEYMKNGSQFCEKGKIYSYKMCRQIKGETLEYPFVIQTDFDVNHLMSEKFFNECFIPYEDFFNIDDQRLFEI
jgi:hypothetical protein